MLFGRSKLELKVGIFVLVGLAILVTFVLLIGDFKTWTSGEPVTFIFNFINGVKVGSPVRFAGVDVGQVTHIDFKYSPLDKKTKILAVCWIRKEVKIPLDSAVWVNTLGLLGEKYLEIIPGQDYDHCLAANQSMDGVDPVAMHDLFKISKNIADNINESIAKLKEGEGTMGKLLNDDALYNELEAAIKNKNGTIGRFIYDDSLYKDVESLIQDLKNNPWKLFWKGKEKPAKK